MYPELAALAAANVVIGHGVACYGAADRYLGMLATVLGDTTRAERHFETALALNRRMGAQTWLAHTAYEYGRMLIARGDARERAMELLRRGRRAGGADRHARAAPPDRARSARRAPPRRRTACRSARSRSSRSSPKGSRNREIGATLFISEHTAANHIRSILRKTRCANRTEAASYAHRHGLAKVDAVGSTRMPLYVIERAFAEELELTGEDVRAIDEINADEGVRWLFSFLSADRRHTYCLYEAPSPDAIRAAAERANVPADAIVEIDGLASPELAPRMREWAAAQAG